MCGKDFFPFFLLPFFFPPLSLLFPPPFLAKTDMKGDGPPGEPTYLYGIYRYIPFLLVSIEGGKRGGLQFCPHKLSCSPTRIQSYRIQQLTIKNSQYSSLIKNTHILKLIFL